MNPNTIFDITTPEEFKTLALEVFAFQFEHCEVYHSFCTHLNKTPENVNQLQDIPFLPISFFKSKRVISQGKKAMQTFTSSGTTGKTTSKHYVADLKLYEKSYLKGFEHFYGAIDDYCILALLPSYLERKGSSLIYMANDLIAKSRYPLSGFYLDDFTLLTKTLQGLEASQTKSILIGVSFALLDLIEINDIPLQHTLVMETGGMKGRRKELIRQELHTLLGKGFNTPHIHSEYGMTELLSQAYSKGNGLFNTPPWMNVMVRDTEDPMSYVIHGKTGGLNIIDLANLYSCSFIATQDLGKTHANGDFEILGRFDHSDVRGCNLMAL